MLEFLTTPIQVSIGYMLLSVSSAVLLIHSSFKNVKLGKELEQEKKSHKNTKQYKYRAERARKERDVLKKQNAELQEFVIFANKVISESDYATKKEYKNPKVKCIGFKKVLENTIKEGHELFR